MNELSLGMAGEVVERAVAGEGDTDRHVLAILGIAVSLNARNILETGVRYGRSTHALLSAADMLDGMVTSVDSMVTSVDSWYAMYTPPEHLLPRWNFIQADAVETLEGLVARGIKYELIMLDDWHAAEHLAKEIELCSKLVMPNHLVLVHDTMWSNTQPDYNMADCKPEFDGGGPAMAVRNLDRSRWEVATIPACNGLTMLRYIGN